MTRMRKIVERAPKTNKPTCVKLRLSWILRQPSKNHERVITAMTKTAALMGKRTLYNGSIRCSSLLSVFSGTFISSADRRRLGRGRRCFLGKLCGLALAPPPGAESNGHYARTNPDPEHVEIGHWQRIFSSRTGNVSFGCALDEVNVVIDPAIGDDEIHSTKIMRVG